VRGFWGKIRRFALRVLSLNSGPRGIALGFALGFALSVPPGFGLGMAAALALSPLVKANPVATYLGTLVVNPFNGVFFYGLDYLVGNWILGREAFVFKMPETASEFFRAARDLAFPAYLGSVPLALACGLVSYFLVLWGVRWWSARHPGTGREHGVQETEKTPET